MEMVYRIPPMGRVADRNDFIVAHCVGKRVLHLGCVESGATTESLANRTLLHVRLLEVAERVVGMDIDAAGLALLQSRGIQNLVEWDVERLAEWQTNEVFDVIIAGEIIEHLSNVGRCLDGVRRIMERCDAVLILTVPNAFSLRHLFPVALRRKELVMPDHTAYFSPSTLSALLSRHHLQIDRLSVQSNLEKSSSPTKRVMKWLLATTLMRMTPQLAEGLIAVVRKA